MPDTRLFFAAGKKVPGFTPGQSGRLNDDVQTKCGAYTCHVTIESFVSVKKKGRKVQTFHVSFYDGDERRVGQTFWKYSSADDRYVVATGAWGVCSGVGSGPFLTKAWNTAKNRCKFGPPAIDNPAPPAVPVVAGALLAAVPGAPALAAGGGPVVMLPVAPAPIVVALPVADATAADDAPE